MLIVKLVMVDWLEYSFRPVGFYSNPNYSMEEFNRALDLHSKINSSSKFNFIQFVEGYGVVLK